ncbi:hypothetical protein [Microbulbifer sp. TRSA005]|uniref:hypothetical protein n=1 Tax=Microbulbifer sp. TRSA005 TaxID=3243383 RepID=UPI0040394472
MKYRDIARTALDRANTILERENDNELHYVALDLRMALEALIYEKALHYHEELSEKKLSTWQPKKLLSILLEIDPFADKSSTLSFALEDENGGVKGDFKKLGNERLLSLKEIKDYYDRIGSYLHTKTIEQSKRPNSSSDKIRSRCLKLSKIIGEAISSSVYNLNMKRSASLDCDECDNKIVRRIRPGSEKYVANCLNCLASYEITLINKSQVHWEPMYIEVPCSGPTCSGTQMLWHREYKIGTNWNCSVCHGHHKITAGIVYTPKESG